MATGTDPLQREQVGVVSRDTGARFQAPSTNSALQLAAALGDVQPALQSTLQGIASQKQADAEAKARAAAIETSGAQLADAVRMGKIKATQNPWFVQAYNRESAAIRSTDQLNALQTDSQQWAEKNDPAAFAKKWHDQVASIAQGFTDPDEIKGFLAAEGQATQQTLATNQSYNSQRMIGERTQNVSILASDALQRVVQANGGHVSGSAAAAALAPAKAQWIATGGSIEDWNKIAISAVTTASYSIRSPGLLDVLKDPALINGPRPDDTSSYGDGVDGETSQLPDPLAPLPEGAAPLDATHPPQEAKPTTVSAPVGSRLQPPALGRITNTFAQHTARGSAGVDIAVPIGTRLQTPIGGIAEVGYQKGKAGLYVKIVSPDGKLQQVLAHLTTTSVENGQHVAPGTVIGRSGQSGDATGPHVHWQLKVNGKQVDPLSYRVEQAHADADHQEAVASGEALPALAPTLAPAPAVQTVPQAAPPEGPSLYDIAGVADQAESDRYHIRSSVNSEAGDKLQAIMNQRRLDALTATDRLYSTFGTKLLTGDVDGQTIISTLSKAGYTPQVIAGAIDNIQNSVSTSASLSTARLSLANANPTHAQQLFSLQVEGVTHGYSPEYEQKVSNAVIAGDISPQEGASWVSQAQSRTESQASEQRAQTSFNERQTQMGTPGQTIRKAGDLKRGIDTYTAQAAAYATKLVAGQSLNAGATKNLKLKLQTTVLAYLADHPNDWAGAEAQARDYVANFLTYIQAHKGRPVASTPSSPSAAGGNPRR